MKKIILAIAAVMGLCSVSSCSDMLDSENTQQVFNPALDSKADSMFYSYGIMQAMQQLADQYVFTGEMRGDLVKTTQYTDNNLRQLADFSATTANKYDSAYVYYHVINNCNYYIAHRDTALYTGSTNVVINEFAAVKAFRAWAYLQLARLYGKVPFFTEPLTTISAINNSKFPELGLQEIVAELAPDLAQYSGLAVPNYGASVSIGATNSSGTKTIDTRKCFIPVDVILGDLYLETGDYANAARYLSTYIIDQSTALRSSSSGSFTGSGPFMTTYYAPLMTQRFFSRNRDFSMPEDFAGYIVSSPNYEDIFIANNRSDIISYIPMSVNYRNGTTTLVPFSFGYNYYRVSGSDDGFYIDEIQVAPSDTYNDMADNAEYYYIATKDWRTGSTSHVVNYQLKGYASLGDTRKNAILHTSTDNDGVETSWIDKYKSANIILYRNSTVMLHLAEALNRLGYPDAAFGILKEGIVTHLVDTTNLYITDATRKLLTDTYPFFNEANINKFRLSSGSLVAMGIHQRGAGVTYDHTFYGSSPYQFDRIVGQKFEQLAEVYPDLAARVRDGLTTKADTINAMEDILCDEYAMELCFEGNRFADLCRMARHKNESALYGANFGSLWLSEKLKYKNPAVDLSDPNNWYLPFR